MCERGTVPSTELRGVLRALHLDQNWVELALPDGTHQKCETPPDTLDDVVGPMVNHRVIAHGWWQKRRGKKDKYRAREIELDEEGDE